MARSRAHARPSRGRATGTCSSNRLRGCSPRRRKTPSDSNRALTHRMRASPDCRQRSGQFLNKWIRLESGEMSEPKVIVGLPVYNGQKYLGPAIESHLSQSFGDFVLVISDNGSTDATPDICSDFAQ